MQIERAQSVILVGEVDKPQFYFGAVERKAVTHKEVSLPEVISRKKGRVTTVTLSDPEQFRAREKAAWMVEEHVKLKLLKCGSHLRFGRGVGPYWDLRQAKIQVRLA